MSVKFIKSIQTLRTFDFTDFIDTSILFRHECLVGYRRPYIGNVMF